MPSPDKSRIEEIVSKYGRHLEGFIRDANSASTPEQLASQMEISPIYFDNQEAGVVGFKVEPTKVGSVAIIKVLYVDPAFRGKKLGPLLEQLFTAFYQQGVTHVEGWAIPMVGHWLEENWGLVPKLRVYHEDVAKLLSKISTLRAPGSS